MAETAFLTEHPKLGPPVYASDVLLRYEPERIKLDQVGVIIPACNEADTVGEVVRTARNAGFDHIYVVDNNSEDDTAARAWDMGAKVIHEGNQGKGEAMLAGVAELDPACRVVMFLDADLKGLRDIHLYALVAPFFAEKPPVDPRLLQTLGPFDRDVEGAAGSNWWYWHVLPFLSGQRAMHRAALEKILEEKRLEDWNPETVINAAFRQSPETLTMPMILDEVYHRPKNEKRGRRVGETTLMLGQVAVLQAREAVRGASRRLRRREPILSLKKLAA